MNVCSLLDLFHRPRTMVRYFTPLSPLESGESMNGIWTILAWLREDISFLLFFPLPCPISHFPAHPWIFRCAPYGILARTPPYSIDSDASSNYDWNKQVTRCEWLRTTTEYAICRLDRIEWMRKEHLLRSKPPIAPPNWLASPDSGRFPCNSVNVFRKSENGLFHICWMALL